MESRQVHFPGDRVTGKAGEAITGGRIVRINDAPASDGVFPVLMADSDDVAADYLALIDIASGGYGPLVAKGVYTVEAGAAISAPAQLMVTTNGKVITAVAPCYVIGIAVSDAADDGDEVVVKLDLPGFYLLDPAAYAPHA